eukprot:gnl/MRDRNA2_/MRDRNA2_28643_c0_seq1.p1 gnl/MRDRNA2_/MRDRNA2_28643_c0~~gnl/MRDRNA2_/MRDRNA2_28643_c0_seq1.p1  ORF type:complete len:1132 (+),score=160.29 gnl/MRDRNA2_/MRDRNA2_28643_c0_seq1:100-3495(+)
MDSVGSLWYTILLGIAASSFRNDRCASNCYECFDSGPGFCDQCLDGYLRDPNGTFCQPICSAYCANCDKIGPGSCNVCKDGFHLPTARSKFGDCSPDTPVYAAAGVSFHDVDPEENIIGGTLTVKSPGADRENSTHYIVYLGWSETAISVDKTQSIGVGPVVGNGADVLIKIEKVKIWQDDKYLLVFSSNLGVEASTPVAVPIQDFKCPPHCTTCAFNATKKCDKCDPGYLFQKNGSPCYPKPPKTKALGASFVDERLKSGEIGGIMKVFVPENEEGITHYSIHWGVDRNVKISNVPSLVARLPVTGNDLSYRLPITVTPDGAAYFLVYSENLGSYLLESEVAVFIKDAGQFNEPRGFTIAGTPQSSSGLWELGDASAGSGPQQLNLPADVVIGSEGIFIADMGNHRVQQYPSGSYSGMSGLTVLKATNRVPLYPASMQVLQKAPGQQADESLMVLSSSTNKIFYVHLPIVNDMPKADVAVESSGADGFVSPEGLMYFGGNLYVADTGNHRIRLFRLPNSQGYTVAGGLGPGAGLDQLHNPRHVFITTTGITQVMYISDSANHRIIKVLQPAELSLDPKSNPGVVVAGGNGAGSAASQLFEPSGVYVTADGSLYIADSGNFRIQRWSLGAKEGSTVLGGTRGTGATQLAYPKRIVLVDHVMSSIDPSRQEPGHAATSTIYVVDSGNHRVQRFPPITVLTSRCTLGSPCEIKLVINRPDVLLRLGKGDELQIVPFEEGTSCGVESPACQPVHWHGVDNPNAIGKLAGNAVLRASHHLGSGIQGPVGQFRMCWGPMPDKKTTSAEGCALKPVDVGIFVMQGPKTLEAECTLGLECIIELKGVGLRTQNRLAMRMPSEDSALVFGNGCKQSWFDTVANTTYWPWPIKALEPYADAEGDPEKALRFKFSAGLTGPVGRKYLLCWSNGWPENYMLDDLFRRRADKGLQYDVRVGTLAVRGPIPTSVECFVFEECNIVLKGVGLEMTNGLLMMAGTHGCGKGFGGQAIEGLDNPATPTTIRSWGSEDPPESELTFKLGVVLNDRFFGNCTICWSHAPTKDPHSYNIEAGHFLLTERGAVDEYEEAAREAARRNRTSNASSSSPMNPATTSVAFSVLKPKQALPLYLAITAMIITANA